MKPYLRYLWLRWLGTLYRQRITAGDLVIEVDEGDSKGRAIRLK